MSRKLQNNRVKQHILLTPTELDLVNCASLSGALSRSSFCTEAISNGLRDPNPTIPESDRRRRINIWIPPEFKAEVQRRAKELGVTQQSLIRQYIRNYAKSLQPPETEQPNPTPGHVEGSIVA
ncbi:MAG TPA: ribbon-helix-helix domain-containing protein [Candidatus Bathyarchaeia archaeon]|nr:ribbon-helix-helix domain-containing protein [Candidatus Bathyarchaeia archaeon]